MPKIPNVTSPVTDIRPALGPIASVDVSSVGRGTAAIGRALEERQSKKNRYEASKANTNFLESYTHEINSYDERDDYQNFDQDFRNNAEQQLNESAALISDTQARDEFVRNGRLKIAQGAERIRDMAFSKEKDVERSTVLEDLNRMKEVGVMSDDMEDIVLNVNDRLDTAVELGYYSNEEKVKVLQGWKENVAVSRIEMMPPEQRIEALEQPWAENIPIRVRAKIKQNAEENLIVNKSIDISDEYIDKDLTRVEALEQMSQIEDDDLRKAVENRFDYQFNSVRQAKSQQQQQIYETYAEDVMTGAKSVDSIPRDEWDQMDFKVKQNLYKLQADSVRPISNSDPDALIDLSLMKAKNDYEGIVQYIREESHRLKPSDRVKYAQIAIDGSMPIEVDDGLTDVQIVQGKLTEADITDKNAKSLLLNQIGDWRRNFITRYNKAPDDNDRDKFIDQMLLEVTTSPGILWDTEKRLFDVSDDEWDNSVRVMNEQDPVIMQKVVSYFNSKNYEPTRGDIAELYQRLRDAKSKADE